MSLLRLAETGNVSAMMHVAQRFELGLFVAERDPFRAFCWYWTAANHPTTRHRHAMAYLPLWRPTPTMASLHAHYHDAARNGLSAVAHWGLGTLLQNRLCDAVGSGSVSEKG